MKKMTFILMIMAACLASAAFAVTEVTNPSFEDDALVTGDADYWTESSDNAQNLIYVPGDAANANFGDDYYQVQNLGGWAVIHTALDQSVEVTPGTNAEIIAYARTEDQLEATGAVALKFEFYATNGEGWQEGVTPFAEVFFDLAAGGYQQIGHVAAVPAGMNFARATIVGSATAVYVDDVWIGAEGTYPGLAGPFAPIPGNGVIVSRTAPPTALSWSIPAEDSGATVSIEFEELNASDPDPNLPSPSTASGTGLETIALSALTPAIPEPLDDGLYGWRVTVGSDVGKTWLFSVGDAPPVPGQPVNQFMWLEQDDSAIPGGDGPSNVRYFEVTATYTDDGESAIVDANFVNLSWGWDPADGQFGVEEVSDTHNPATKTVTAIYKTLAVGDDLSNPLDETTIPGNWNIQLQVTDANPTVSGVAGHHEIWATCGEAAGADPDIDFNATYDVNDDCINDFVDFSAFAATWLDASPKFE